MVDSSYISSNVVPNRYYTRGFNDSKAMIVVVTMMIMERRERKKETRKKTERTLQIFV